MMLDKVICLAADVEGSAETLDRVSLMLKRLSGKVNILAASALESSGAEWPPVKNIHEYHPAN